MIPYSIQVLAYKQLQSALKIGAKILNFRQPELFSGPGSSLDLCDHIAKSGVHKVLLVSDEFLLKIGLLQPMIDRLESHGVNVVAYTGVQPDPTIEQVEAGLAMLRQHGSKAVLAVGGGSSIDAAKMIAARARNPHKVVHMGGLFRVIVPPLPLYAIPTTAGTGSEATIGAVISDPETTRKFVVMDPKLVPLAAALDATLMTGLPAAGTTATGMDALTHAVEAYLSNNATSATDAEALEATRLVMENLPQVLRDGTDLEARQRMAIASYKAGVAITTAGIGWVHAISHNLGALYHLPHGYLNAIILPRVLDLYRPVCQARLADLARVSGLEGTDESALADAFIAHVRALNVQFGIPTQVDKLQDADIAQIVERAMGETHWNYAVPVYMDKSRTERMVRDMLPATA